MGIFSWFKGTPEPEAKRLRAPSPKPMTGRLIHAALFIGAPGTGKTTDLQEVVERNWRDGCRFVISDRLGYWGYMRDWPNVHVLQGGTHEEACAYAIQKVPYSTVVIDEIAEAVPANEQPDEESARWEILRAGRNACAFGKWRRPGPVAMLGACQQPHQIHVRARGLFDRLYVSRLTEQPAIIWVKGFDEGLAERARVIPYGLFAVHDRL
ncbi:MAG TPA: ATP-binding protein [Planctomycetota bacterium]|nr:ATP-binding protein [Planctomycetota bacterium]